jgi:hypothetical protein
MSIVVDEGETSKDQQPESIATTSITVDEGVSNTEEDQNAYESKTSSTSEVSATPGMLSNTESQKSE